MNEEASTKQKAMAYREEWYAYIAERYRVMRRRNSGMPVPWTQDEVIQRTAFCNVFREDDPTTHVVIDILRRCETIEDVVVSAVMCRMVNKIDTIRAIGRLTVSSASDATVQAHIVKMIDTHGFGGAYVIPSMGKGKGTKPTAVAQKIAEVSKQVTPERLKTMRDAGSVALYDFLTEFKYIGQFLAYQICIDIGYWSREMYDEDAHVIAVCGALRGLQWLFPDVKRWTPELITSSITELRDNAPQELLTLFGDRRWTLMTVENCLCEGDKYLRIKHGTGKTKRVRNYTGK